MRGEGCVKRERVEWLRLLSHLSSIVDVYDRMNRVMSLGLDLRVRREFLDRVEECCPRPRVVVDVGCGPGTLASLISEKWGPYIVAVDPLPEMLDALGGRCRNPLVDRVVAVGEHLPLRDGAADLVTAAFSLRDFIDWRRGLGEMSRVSRCCVAVLDIARAESRLKLLLELAWWGLIVPLAALLVARRSPARYIALARTILRWSPPSVIANVASGYGRVSVEHVAGGFAFRMLLEKPGAHRPSGDGGERSEVCAETRGGVVRAGAARGGLHQGCSEGSGVRGGCGAARGA